MKRRQLMSSIDSRTAMSNQPKSLSMLTSHMVRQCNSHPSDYLRHPNSLFSFSQWKSSKEEGADKERKQEAYTQ